jgi:signal transduction histidine kinase
MFSEKNLRSIIYNLLSNALKYHHPDRPPRVRVLSRVEGPWQVLEVHDNGLGLDESQQQELFTMFRRLHSHVEGSGLGLYMVQRILANAGGRIEVRSQPEQGSTFRVHIPWNPA